MYAYRNMRLPGKQVIFHALRLSLGLVPLVLLAAGALAQAIPGSGAPGGFLLPPSLPSMLPGGAPLPSLPAVAQQEIMARIQQSIPQRAGAPPVLPMPAPAAAVPPALAPAAPPEEQLSVLERFFAARLAGEPQPLRQFGYETFAGSQGAAPPGFGALSEDHLIGRDDELIVALRGRVRQTHTARVGRDGMLLLPDLAPIVAAGRSIREVRADLDARARQEMGGTEAYLSFGALRQMGVLVAGEVLRPGIQSLTPLSTVIDALAAAGGVRKTGSLRALRIDGPRGSRVVDLYGILTGDAGAPDIALREGERVMVPALGAAIAIAGDVTRPGIYELPAGAASVSVEHALALAGGALRPLGNRLLVFQSDAQGRRVIAEVAPAGLLRRGDAMRVAPGLDVEVNGLRLVGHVTAPITRSTAGATRLAALLSDPRLVRADAYVPMGVIWRAERPARQRRFIAFPLGRVLASAADLPLQEADEVVVLARSDIAWLASPPVQRALRGEMGEGAGACAALLQVAIAARASPARFAHARGAGFPDLGAPACPAILARYPDLLAYLLDQAVVLTGEARQPGLYPVPDDTGLDVVVAAAGGSSDAADLGAVEFAREPAEASGAIPLTRISLDLRSRNFAAVRLSPRDVLRIPRGFADRETGPVTLVGEFLRPGTYDIRRGERLSELIARAGGLTREAFPYGTVFTRESVRQRQQEGFARTARELEMGMVQVAAGQAVVGTRGGGGDLGGAVAAGRELAHSLRETRAAGRMVVEANPVVLAGRPEFDVLLEPGDLIAVPKRPNEVTVVGSVLNAGSLQFRSGWRASDYVRAAGGQQRFADGGRAFIVLPNGQSVPAGLGSWQQGGPPVPPGSLVVVPQDPSPYENWAFVRDLTQVLSQVSVSAAALAVITRGAR
jgi:polysaccharide export outer membrane protein